jgi:hypothetical protein
LDKLKRNKNIKHKYGKEIYVIEIFVIKVLCKRIISYLWVHADARLDVDEKNIIFRSVTFQNIIQNLCNADLVTHLHVDLY